MHVQNIVVLYLLVMCRLPATILPLPVQEMRTPIEL